MTPDDCIRDEWRLVYDKAQSNLKDFEDATDEKKKELVMNGAFLLLPIMVAGMMSSAETKTEKELAEKLEKRFKKIGEHLDTLEPPDDYEDEED